MKPIFLIIGLSLVLIVVILTATGFGSADISLLDIFKMMLNKLGIFHFAAGWRDIDETIIFQLRLPRVIGAILVGGGLATAGVLLQGLLRNPMADPYITGTSGGAALGAVIAMILPLNISILGFGIVPIFAFFGALGTILIVYTIARRGSGKAPVVNILLAGFVISSLYAAAIAFMMTMSSRLSLNLHSVYSFLFGHISVTDWSQLAVIAPIIAIGITGSLALTNHLNAFALGEDGASYLGIQVEKAKIIILALASLLTAAAVSISGLVGFVGLVIPHVVRIILGPDHRLLLPVSVLAGGIFMVLADLLARTILSPVEIPVGIVTAIIGGPFFLYLLHSRKREYSFQ